ncbi:MAG: hypothetical protein ABMA01_23710, partial [Chthoniobacteraceae bacterium]
AALTHSNAEDAGRAVPDVEDLTSAIAAVLPSTAELPPAPASAREARKRTAEPAHPLGTDRAAAMQTPCKSRETRPRGIAAPTLTPTP